MCFVFVKSTYLFSARGIDIIKGMHLSNLELAPIPHQEHRLCLPGKFYLAAQPYQATRCKQYHTNCGSNMSFTDSYSILGSFSEKIATF